MLKVNLLSNVKRLGGQNIINKIEGSKIVVMLYTGLPYELNIL